MSEKSKIVVAKTEAENKSKDASIKSVSKDAHGWAWTVVAIIATLIIIAGIASVMRGGNKQKTEDLVICPEMSADETRSCIIGPNWSSWVRTVPGKRACAFPSGQFERKEEDGVIFFRFKTNGGNLTKLYRLVPENEKCPQTL